MARRAVGRFGNGASVDDAKLGLLPLLSGRIAHLAKLVCVPLRLVLIRPAPESDDLKLFHTDEDYAILCQKSPLCFMIERFKREIL